MIAPVVHERRTASMDKTAKEESNGDSDPRWAMRRAPNLDGYHMDLARSPRQLAFMTWELKAAMQADLGPPLRPRVYSLPHHSGEPCPRR